MRSPVLESLIARASALARERTDPADCVLALAPLMLELIEQATTFLDARHCSSDPDHPARHRVHAAPDGSVGLDALVWSPGHWTPVDDLGHWGVVGVLEGVLEKRSYVRLSDGEADEGIRLVRGGVTLLPRGAVTGFVPDPDHVHVTGVPPERPRAVGLHLHGRWPHDRGMKPSTWRQR
jgi:predicted metal-dependent enzyme (double-stranded beta helix superfamily)